MAFFRWTKQNETGTILDCVDIIKDGKIWTGMGLTREAALMDLCGQLVNLMPTSVDDLTSMNDEFWKEWASPNHKDWDDE